MAGVGAIVGRQKVRHVRHIDQRGLGVRKLDTQDSTVKKCYLFWEAYYQQDPGDPGMQPDAFGKLWGRALKQEFVKGRYARVLMELCEDHDLASLRATDVIAASGLSKPTFYNHFANLSELVNFTASRSYLETETNLFSESNIKASYDYALDHRSFFLQLPSQQGFGSFKETSRRWLRKKGYALYIPPTLPRPERLRRIVQVDMFLSGTLDVMETWLAGGMVFPAEEIVAAVVSMMPPFMAGSDATAPDPAALNDFPK